MLFRSPFWKNSPAAYREKVANFYAKMHRPVDFATEVGEANDVGQLRLIGFVSTAISIFIGLCIVLPNPIEGRLQIAAVSVFVAFFGLMMLAFARRLEKKNKEGKS